jgi:hypothetical protein
VDFFLVLEIFSIHKSETEMIFDGELSVLRVRVLFCLEEVEGSL